MDTATGVDAQVFGVSQNRSLLGTGAGRCADSSVLRQADAMTVHIEANLQAYRRHGSPESRYASFDYCYNYFQEARDAGETYRLADDDRRQSSCLQLGFYFASWGMMRGSGDLLQNSVRGLVPVVEQIADESTSTWDLDADSYADNAEGVLALGRRVRRAFQASEVDASDILVTKTMLGVFGCVPAFDLNFRRGFGPATLSPKTLKKIGVFYRDNQAEIEAAPVLTLDFVTGEETERRYSSAKIIDMVFFQEGFSRS